MKAVSSIQDDSIAAKAYVKAMAQNGVYGTDLEIAALSLLTKRPIVRHPFAPFPHFFSLSSSLVDIIPSFLGISCCPVLLACPCLLPQHIHYREKDSDRMDVPAEVIDLSPAGSNLPPISLAFLMSERHYHLLIPRTLPSRSGHSHPSAGVGAAVSSAQDENEIVIPGDSAEDDSQVPKATPYAVEPGQPGVSDRSS